MQTLDQRLKLTPKKTLTDKALSCHKPAVDLIMRAAKIGENLQIRKRAYPMA